jgi:hypothetical protein
VRIIHIVAVVLALFVLLVMSRRLPTLPTRVQILYWIALAATAVAIATL